MEPIYYAVKVIALLWMLMVAMIALFSANRSLEKDRFSGFFLGMTLSTVLPIIGYTVDAGRSAPGAFSRGFPVCYMGFLVFLLGLFLNWAGILTLKRQWSGMVVIQKDHQLIETGVYKYIRHPIYAAILLEIFGMGLALANWITILALLIPNAVSLIYRIHVEERALADHFGEAYMDYARKTKRLIPGIL